VSYPQHYARLAAWQELFFWGTELREETCAASISCKMGLYTQTRLKNGT
jgi:hypothetical protein